MFQAFNKSQLNLIKPHRAYTGETENCTSPKINNLARELMFKHPRQNAYRIANDRVGKHKSGQLNNNSHEVETALEKTQRELSVINDLVEGYMRQGITRKKSLIKAKKQVKSTNK
jgi:hypothetical protein